VIPLRFSRSATRALVASLGQVQYRTIFGELLDPALLSPLQGQ